VNHHGSLRSQHLEDRCQLTGEEGIVDTHHLSPGSGGIGQWTQDIEYCTQSQLPSDRSHPLHGRVENRGKHESYAQALDHGRHRLRSGADVHSQLGEHIGAAALRAYGIVAVLGHRHTAGSSDYGRCRAHIYGIGSVPSCAAGVHQNSFHLGADAYSRIPHLTGKAGDLRHGLAFHAQSYEKGPDLGVGGAAEDVSHQCFGLGEGQVTSFHDLLKIIQCNHQI